MSVSRMPALVAGLAVVLAMGGSAAASAAASGTAASPAHGPRPLSMAGVARLGQQLGQPVPSATGSQISGPGAGSAAAAPTAISAAAAGPAGNSGAVATAYRQGCRLTGEDAPGGRLAPGRPACAVSRQAAAIPARAGSTARAASRRHSAGTATALSAAASIQLPDLLDVGSSGAVDAALTLPGRPDDVVRFEGDGDVALVGPSGLPVWDRQPQSFARSWKVALPPVRANGFAPRLNPTILAGPSPLFPSVAAGTPYAVGSIPGEHDPVVAVGHKADLIGGSMAAGHLALPNSFVTVLDGRTGATLWSREYPGLIMQLRFAGGHLIVGDTAGPASQSGLWGMSVGGPAGTVSSLDDWAFQPSGSGLSGTRAGSVTVHTMNAMWLALSPAGPGTVAAAWTDTPLGIGAHLPEGHVLALSVATGRVRWNVATPEYPRQLAFDSSRGQVVVEEQADLTQKLGYTLTGLRASNGSVASQIARDNALPFETLQIGHVTGSSAVSWAVTEQPYVSCPPPFQGGTCLGTSQAVAFTPGSGAPAWVAQLPAGGPAFSHSPKEPYGLLLTTGSAGPEVVVASQQLGAISSPQTPLGDFTQDELQLGSYSDLRALAGSDGHLLWDHSGGDEVSPTSIVTTSQAGKTAVASFNEEQDLHVFAAAGGSSLASQAMFAGGMYTAASADVNGDGTPDLIVGGESGGVFAVDGAGLGSTPHILWHTTVGAPIHKISVVRLSKTGPAALVVAATDKLAVLSLNGAARYQVSFPGQFVWTFAAGDLGNGSTGIVVATNALTMLDGLTGHRLWSYQPDGGSALFSDPVISAKGTVVADSAVPPASGKAPGTAADQAVAGLDGVTGKVVWTATAASPAGAYTEPLVDGGVAASPDIPGAGGNGVALTWMEGSTPDVDSTEVDVRDADTGALQYTQTVPDLGPVAVATGPAFGVAVCGSSDGGGGPSVADIQPTGVILHQPGPVSCSAAAVAGGDFVTTLLGGGPLYVTPGNYPLAGTGSAAAVWDSRHDIEPAAVTSVALGARTGNAVGLTYDWEAEQDLGIPMNDFGFTLNAAMVPTGVATYALPQSSAAGTSPASAVTGTRRNSR